MAEFQVNDKVIFVSTGAKGIITEVIESGKRRRGRQYYRVKWEDNREEPELEGDLMKDFDISEPFQRAEMHVFGTYKEYARKNTTFKIKNSNNNSISTLKASKTLFRPYQFRPLMKFLNSPYKRLLIADEVGLGKTIEAGHILLELKARRELRNVLIICSKSLQHKWKEELFNRFGLDFDIMKNGAELIDKLKVTRTGVKAIITYDTIRTRRQVRTDEEEKKDTDRKQPAQKFIEYLDETDIRLSMVICDEAHQLRNSDTLRYRGAEILLNRADAAIFLTATPVMLGTEDLYNQLHLLNNVTYYNREIFDNQLEENKPFIRALSELGNFVPFSEIDKNLCSAKVKTQYGSLYYHDETVEEHFAEYPVFQEIIKTLRNKKEDNRTRAKLHYDLSSMSIINSIFSRTRKKEVTTDLSQAVRKPHLHPIELTNREQMEFDSVIEEYIEEHSEINDWGEDVMTKGGALGLIQKKRQIASSVNAYLSDEADLDEGIDVFEDEEDTKFNELVKIMNEVFKHGTRKLIVFALFRKTLKYLALRFKSIGIEPLMIYGDISDRQQIINDFRTKPEYKILLSTEVGSEGLDMQFCNSMVNYDLPWNPMVVEQRIGRIDRFGQKSPVVNIYNMVVKDSIQEVIYERLLERIGIFHDSIGDMEAILDAECESKGCEGIKISQLYSRLEKELYTQSLTKEEMQRKIEEVASAVEHEKENLKQLESGLTNSLTNDDYFKQEIERIVNNRAFVTEEELINYVSMVQKEYLTTCVLQKCDDHRFNFHIPASDRRVLLNFLTQYQPVDVENDLLFRSYKHEISETLDIPITFSQETAYDDRSVQFLNLYHPIVQAATEYYIKKEDPNHKTFSFALHADERLKEGDQYMMAVYQMPIEHTVQGKKVKSSVMVPILFDMLKNELVEDEELTEHVFSKSCSEGYDKNIDYSLLDHDFVADMKIDFYDKIGELRKEKEDELRRQAENTKMRDLKQLDEWFNSEHQKRKENISQKEFNLHLAEIMQEKEDVIRKCQRELAAAKGQMTRLENEYEERKSILGANQNIDVKKELLSLNYVYIG